MRWRSPLPARRTESGVGASQVVLGAVLVVTLAGGAFWVVTQRQAAPGN